MNSVLKNWIEIFVLKKNLGLKKIRIKIDATVYYFPQFNTRANPFQLPKSVTSTQQKFQFNTKTCLNDVC